MRVKEIPHGLQLAKPAEGYVRSAGLHASDLYGAYYKAFDPKRYDKRDKDGNSSPMDLAKLEFGLSFEQVLEVFLASMMEETRRQMARRLFGERPGEFNAPHHEDCINKDHEATALDPCTICAAGTAFSPDFLFDDALELILGEFKLSWYSSRDCPHDPKFAKWITQMMLYCWWLNITKARLFVYFVNDDYAPPTPNIRAWEFTFTRAELETEAARIIRHCRKEGLIKAA